MSDERLTLRLVEKLFVKKLKDERLETDCINALACVDFCLDPSCFLLTNCSRKFSLILVQFSVVVLLYITQHCIAFKIDQKVTLL